MVMTTVELENGDVVEIDDHKVWVWLKTSAHDIEEHYRLVDLVTDAVRFEDSEMPQGNEDCPREFDMPYQDFAEDCKIGRCVPQEYYQKSLNGELNSDEFTYL